MSSERSSDDVVHVLYAAPENALYRVQIAAISTADTVIRGVVSWVIDENVKHSLERVCV